MTCEICAAPAAVSGTTELQGVDFDGSETLFVVETIRCAAGHRYDSINDERSVRL